MIIGKKVIIRPFELGDEVYLHKWWNDVRLGEDALRIFIDFMSKNLNLNKIELTTMKDNKRAQSLYKKLGFKRNRNNKADLFW